jgi:protein-tyrosine phosphatase
VTAAYGDWIRLVPTVGEPLVLTVRDLGLASDPNLRDIGGYRTTDGQWVRMGVVYRSQALSLSPADLAVVDNLGITADYDLRTTEEIAESPDVVPATGHVPRRSGSSSAGRRAAPSAILTRSALQ